jgi:CDP-6-deoxy-D-xylo-4-hexulose-3-dehydrase
MAHIVTCAGNGGMVLLESDQLRDLGLMLRRWGRRSEPHLYGTGGKGRVFREDLDGIPYDNDFIFDVLPWNFEPSELGAAYGLAQLDKLPAFWATRQRHFAAYSEYFRARSDLFVPARQTEGVDTAWLCYPVLVQPDAGFSRADLQEYLEVEGVDTRTIWTGNVTRQPMMKGVEFRQPADGLPNADRVMETGMLLPCGHGITDEQRDVVLAKITAFLDKG